MIAPAFLNGAKPLSAALQKVQSTYVRTVMDSRTGKVVELGSILVLQIDGVMANPMRSSSGPYWNVSTGGQIGPDNGFAASSLNAAATNTRSLAVGEKVYIYGLSIGANSIAFRVQSCGTCDPKAVDLANQPYRASVEFKFAKGSLASAEFDQIKQVIDQVFKFPDDTSPGNDAGDRREPPQKPAPVAQLRLPCRYASAQTPADQLQLNADNSFSLQEGGQSYHGTFVVNGNTVELSISETNTKTTATIQGTNLSDSSGQTWVLREQPAEVAPSVVTLQNDDVIKMVRAGFDDAIILAKISGSRCQFDTSTDGLIRLKQSGVSAAVIKAIVISGK
jgi:hypothetical protein